MALMRCPFGCATPIGPEVTTNNPRLFCITCGSPMERVWEPARGWGSPSALLDRRLMRAQALTAAVMKTLEPCTLPGSERAVYQALIELFYQSGAELSTDFDRADAGLAPRDGDGYTATERTDFETRLREALLSPRPVVLAWPRG